MATCFGTGELVVKLVKYVLNYRKIVTELANNASEELWVMV
jgi:hypothetical protein